jgi:hypothetical protein
MLNPGRRAACILGCGLFVAVFQCGARTGLNVPEERVIPDVADALEEDVHEEDVAEEDVIVIDAMGNCPPEATLIYITGSGGALYSFWPPSFMFTFIGNLTCTTSPTHMTVDRHGVALVVADGQLYRASTVDAACAAVTNWTPQPAGFKDFALTFVGTNNNDTSLYLLGDTSVGLFDIVMGTFTIVGAPPIPNIMMGGDMTANGDGTLYFLHDISQPVLYDLDPTDAHVLRSFVVSASGGGSQALAYFGGLFYAFEDNVVSSFDTATNTTTFLGIAPIDVTGAGQSTCVPTTPTDAGAPD